MKVGVYGLGRFGFFWAEQLAQYATVLGYNRTDKESFPRGVIKASEEEVLQCDTVVLCTAISSMEEVVHRIAPHLKSGSVVMDTCSVKVYPAEVMSRLLDEEIGIIATHPMFGPDSGKGGIANLPLVFSPIRGEESPITWWRDLFNRMELNVIEMSCQEHDKEAAYSQGVTHFIGRVLDELNLQPTELATVGYKSLLTIIEHTCNDPIQLFYDLQRYNPYTKEMHHTLKSALDKTLKILEMGQKESE